MFGDCILKNNVDFNDPLNIADLGKISDN